MRKRSKKELRKLAKKMVSDNVANETHYYLKKINGVYVPTPNPYERCKGLCTVVTFEIKTRKSSRLFAGKAIHDGKEPFNLGRGLSIARDRAVMEVVKFYKMLPE